MPNPLQEAELYTWIASWPKSGNTYLRLLIEAYYRNGYVDINDVQSSVGDNSEYWFRNVSPVSGEELTVDAALLLRPAALFNQLASMHTKKRFCKTHCVNASINKTPHLIPSALTKRAVYIVRDPRDVAISMTTYMNTGEGISIEEAAQHLNEIEYGIMEKDVGPVPLSTWSMHVETWADETRYPVAVMRYEDLCANPQEEFAQFLQFCEIDPDMDRVERAVEACALAKLAKQERERGFREDYREKVLKPFFHKGGSRWREEMPAEVARKIESDHAEVMDRFGYEVDNGKCIEQDYGAVVPLR